jgi:hypothetical protein
MALATLLPLLQVGVQAWNLYQQGQHGKNQQQQFQQLMEQMGQYAPQGIDIPDIQEMDLDFSGLRSFIPQAPDALDWRTAQQRAGEQVGYQYDRQSDDRLRQMDQQAISRGFYGQLPADALRGRRAADMEMQKNAAIASLGQQLQQQNWANRMQHAGFGAGIEQNILGRQASQQQFNAGQRWNAANLGLQNQAMQADWGSNLANMGLQGMGLASQNRGQMANLYSQLPGQLINTLDAAREFDPYGWQRTWGRWGMGEESNDSNGDEGGSNSNNAQRNLTTPTDFGEWIRRMLETQQQRWQF